VFSDDEELTSDEEGSGKWIEVDRTTEQCLKNSQWAAVEELSRDPSETSLTWLAPA